MDLGCFQFQYSRLEGVMYGRIILERELQMADTQEQEVIDWDEAPEWANYVAKDRDGRVYWFSLRPFRFNTWTIHHPGVGLEVSGNGVKIPGPWEDSLRKRPENNTDVVATEAAAATAHHDTINHPDHYQGDNGIECIDAIQAALTPEEFRGYCKGNIIKYAWRERKKGGDESLRKARWHVNKLLGDV